jgi:outer membrane lipopolysaccharide assembly protein LptE/RlpB
MTFSKLYKWLLFLPLIFVLSGCGYHLTSTTAQRLTVGEELWVPFIGNESVSPSAQTVLRRALYDECHALRGLVAAESKGAAALVMKGKLLSYGSGVMAYNAADQVRTLRMNISVELELFRKGELKPLWKGVLSASKDYQAQTDLALQRNAEESALDGAARIIAQKLITAAEQSF